MNFQIESREIIDPTDYRQSKSEGKGMFLHILKLLLELITALLFLLLDHIIYVLLDIVRNNARIEYYQEGEHILNIQVRLGLNLVEMDHLYQISRLMELALSLIL